MNSSKISVFKVDGQGQLVLDKEYLRGIPEFKCILERQYPMKGDHDGRKKVMNWQLFMYVEMVGSMFSYPNKGGYTEKETHEAAVREAKLDDKYKPDEEILAAINKFKEIELALMPSLTTLNSTLKGLRASGRISEMILRSMEAHMEQYNKKLEEAEKNGDTANIADLMLIINGLLDHLSNLQKIALTIPKTMEVVEKLIDKIKKEGGGDTIGRGGRTIGNRADPR